MPPLDVGTGHHPMDLLGFLSATSKKTKGRFLAGSARILVMMT
jgi:hypothetical protein